LVYGAKHIIPPDQVECNCLSEAFIGVNRPNGIINVIISILGTTDIVMIEDIVKADRPIGMRERLDINGVEYFKGGCSSGFRGWFNSGISGS